MTRPPDRPPPPPSPPPPGGTPGPSPDDRFARPPPRPSPRPPLPPTRREAPSGPWPTAAGGGTAPASGELFGQYRIVGHLGEGGWGAVLRAVHPVTQKEVALKILKLDAAAGGGTEADRDAAVRRFLGEAQILGQLDHPGIVSVHDAGVHDGRAYIVMDLVPGLPLAEVIRKRARPQPDLLAAVAEAARALHHAHGHEIVHRDVKPANLMVQPDGRVRVLDFGIARDLEGERHTRTGQMLGSVPYMAPEQVQAGERGVDQRTDVYGLGATLYEVLTGRPPFEGAGQVEIIMAVMRQEPVTPSTVRPGRVHRDLDTICLTALEKDPARRYETAAAFADDIERFLSGEPIAARPPGLALRAARLARRVKLPLAIATAALLTAGGLLLGPRVVEARRAAAHEGARAQLTRLVDERAAAARAALAVDPSDDPGDEPGASAESFAIRFATSAVRADLEARAGQLGALLGDAASREAAIAEALARYPGAPFAAAVHRRDAARSAATGDAAAARRALVLAYRTDPRGPDGLGALLEAARGLLHTAAPERALGIARSVRDAADAGVGLEPADAAQLGAAARALLGEALLRTGRPGAAAIALDEALARTRSPDPRAERAREVARWLGPIRLAPLPPGRLVVADPDGDGRDALLAIDPDTRRHEAIVIHELELDATVGSLRPARTNVIELDQLRLESMPPSFQVWVVDLEADGRDELIVSAGDGDERPGKEVIAVIAFEGGAPRVTATGVLPGSLGWPAVGDIDGDGRTDLVAAMAGARIVCWPDAATRGLRGRAIDVGSADGSWIHALAIADVDGDGQSEVVVGIGAWKVYAVDIYETRPSAVPGEPRFARRSRTRVGWPQSLLAVPRGGDAGAEIWLANRLPQDGRIELAPGAAAGLLALDASRETPTVRPLLRDGAGASVGAVLGPIRGAPGDDPNGVLVLETVGASRTRISLVSGAAIEDRVVFEPHDPESAGVLIADLDGDGADELVLTASRDGRPVAAVLGLGASLPEAPDDGSETRPTAAATAEGDAAATGTGLDDLLDVVRHLAALDELDAADALGRQIETAAPRGSRARAQALLVLAEVASAATRPEEAARLCREAAATHEQLARVALIAASRHAERAWNMPAALEATDRLLERLDLSADDRRRAERRRARLRRLTALAPRVTLEQILEAGGEAGVELAAPWAIRRAGAGGGLQIDLRSERGALLRVPIEHDGGAIGLLLEVDVERLAFTTRIGAALRGATGDALRLDLSVSGGGRGVDDAFGITVAASKARLVGGVADANARHPRRLRRQRVRVEALVLPSLGRLLARATDIDSGETLLRADRDLPFALDGGRYWLELGDGPREATRYDNDARVTVRRLEVLAPSARTHRAGAVGPDEDAATLRARAAAARLLGRPGEDSVLAACRAARTADPTDPGAALLLAAATADAGRAEEAAAILEQIRRAAEPALTAELRRTWAHLKPSERGLFARTLAGNKLPSADEHLEIALQVTAGLIDAPPPSPRGGQLAQALLRLRARDEAYAALSAYANGGDLEPDNVPLALDAVSALAMRCARWEDAVTICERLLADSKFASSRAAADVRRRLEDARTLLAAEDGRR